MDVSLDGPLPVANLRPVDPILMRVVDRVDDLILQPLLGVRGAGLQLWHAVDDVDCEVEAVGLVQDRELQRCVDIALLLVAADVHIVVIGTAIGELVDERRVGVEVEDHRLVEREERVEFAVGQAVRMLALGHQAEEIDDVDEADFQVGAAFAQDCDSGEGL